MTESQFFILIYILIAFLLGFAIATCFSLKKFNEEMIERINTNYLLIEDTKEMVCENNYLINSIIDSMPNVYKTTSGECYPIYHKDKKVG